MLALRDGRYPVAVDELAEAETLADEVGSTLRIDDAAEMRVVGLVENPNDLSDAFLLASEAFAASAPSMTLLVDGDDNRAKSFHGTGDMIPVYSSRGGTSGSALVAVLAMTEVALVLVSLIAAAGFVAMAQRRKRQLGAPRRPLRRTVVAAHAHRRTRRRDHHCCRMVADADRRTRSHHRGARGSPAPPAANPAVHRDLRRPVRPWVRRQHRHRHRLTATTRAPCSRHRSGPGAEPS